MKILALMHFILNRIERIEKLLTEVNVLKDPLKHHALVRLVAQVGEAFKYFREKPETNEESYLVISAIYMVGSGFSAIRDQLIHSYWENTYQSGLSKNMFSHILKRKLVYEISAIKEAFEEIWNKEGLENIETEAYEAKFYQGEIKYFYKLGDYIDFMHLAISEFKACYQFYLNEMKSDKTESEKETAHIGICGYVQCIGQLLADFNGLWALTEDQRAVTYWQEEVNAALKLFRYYRNELSHLSDEAVEQKTIYALSAEDLNKLYESSIPLLLYIQKTSLFLEKTERVHQNIFGTLKHALYKDFYNLLSMDSSIFTAFNTEENNIHQIVIDQLASISVQCAELIYSKQLPPYELGPINQGLAYLKTFIDFYLNHPSYSDEQRLYYKVNLDQLTGCIENISKALSAMNSTPSILLVEEEESKNKRERSRSSSPPTERKRTKEDYSNDVSSLQALLHKKDREIQTLKELLSEQTQESKRKTSSPERKEEKYSQEEKSPRNSDEESDEKNEKSESPRSFYKPGSPSSSSF